MIARSASGTNDQARGNFSPVNVQPNHVAREVHSLDSGTVTGTNKTASIRELSKPFLFHSGVNPVQIEFFRSG
jgi:hypothetical protein